MVCGRRDADQSGCWAAGVVHRARRPAFLANAALKSAVEVPQRDPHIDLPPGDTALPEGWRSFIDQCRCHPHRQGRRRRSDLNELDWLHRAVWNQWGLLHRDTIQLIGR